MRKIAIAIGIILVAIAIAAIVLFVNHEPTANASTLEGTKSPANFVGKDICKGCHPTEYNQWNGSNHAMDFTQKDYHGAPINLFTYSGGSCRKCHVVGFNNTAQDGYNISEPYDSAHNSKLLGIQCENCHGAGSDHAASPSPTTIAKNPTIAASCDGDAESFCHGPKGHNNYWVESKHAESLDAAGGSVATDEFCQPCHTREGFVNKLDDTTYAISNPNPVDCAACHDPHEDANEFQLRLPVEELCVECHNNGYELVPGPEAEIHHPQAEIHDGTGGAGVTQGTGMPGVECPDCHMFATPSVTKYVYNSTSGKWDSFRSTPISELNSTLLSYDTNRGHWFKPTAEACAACHSSILSSMPASYNESDSSLQTSWSTWGPLWDTEVEKWQLVIDGWQEDFEERWAEVNETLTKTYNDLVAANATGDVDNASLEKAWDLYYKALWNLDMTAGDSSDGVHNFDYEMALLDKAEEYSETVGELIKIKAAEPPVTPKEPTDYTMMFAIVIVLLLVSLLLSIVAIMRKPKAPTDITPTVKEAPIEGQEGK